MADRSISPNLSGKKPAHRLVAERRLLGGKTRDARPWRCSREGASADPDPVVHGPLIERLVSPESAIPLSGSRAGPAHDQEWVVICLSAYWLEAMPALSAGVSIG